MESENQNVVWVGREPLGPSSPTLQQAQFLMYQAVFASVRLPSEGTSWMLPFCTFEDRIMWHSQCWDPLTNSKATHTTVSSNEKASTLCLLPYVE